MLRLNRNDNRTLYVVPSILDSEAPWRAPGHQSPIVSPKCFPSNYLVPCVYTENSQGHHRWVMYSCLAQDEGTTAVWSYDQPRESNPDTPAWVSATLVIQPWLSQDLGPYTNIRYLGLSNGMPILILCQALDQDPGACISIVEMYPSFV